MNRSCDTNIVQSLFIMINRPDKYDSMVKNASPQDMIELHIKAKKIRNGTAKQELYVTPLVMHEVENCESKYPGIVQFARENFMMRTTTSRKLIESIIELEDVYLTEDEPLNDDTRGLHSAVLIETKNGVPSRADAHILAENNVLNGFPFFTLNEKHLICVKHSNKPNRPHRSYIILKKNREFLESHHLHKVAKKNLKKNTATTFKVKNFSKNNNDLLNAMLQELS